MVRTDYPRTTPLRFPKVFHFFLQRFIFFLTQCHGSPWRGRQCTRHLIRSSFSALLSVLGITLTKCTSLTYTQYFQANNMACWPPMRTQFVPISEERFIFSSSWEVFPGITCVDLDKVEIPWGCNSFFLKVFYSWSKPVTLIMVGKSVMPSY